MCFSPQASFTVGGALLPTGLYCVTAALRKDARYLPMALIPIVFGVQQLTEGVVWLSFDKSPALIRQVSVVYLFFPLAFWPFWVPFSLLTVENRPWARSLLGLMTVLSLVWWWVYLPIVADPSRWLATEVVRHSIRYQVEDIPAFQVVSRPVWRLWYLVCVCVPLVVGRWGAGRERWGSVVGGTLVALLFVVSAWVYWYAFASVWCFFAAILSVLLCLVFARLPARAPTPSLG